jgi:hypothetical protein
VVFGGASLGGSLAAPALQTYEFIDYIVQGEGEARFARLLDAIDRGERQPSIAGVLDRRATANALTQSDIALPLDQLPVPDFSEYYDAIDAFDYPVWALLPIEVSRQRDQADAPAGAKSVRRVAEEIRQQMSRHRRLRLMLVGDVGAGDGVEQLAGAIEDLGTTPSCAVQLQTSIHPYQVFRLWEAGCDKVEFDFDSLSDDYLRRRDSGFALIDVLQAMRICYELGIRNFTPLTTHLPGATDDDVRRTVDAIRRFAFNYQPLDIRRFTLSETHALLHAPDRFGIARVRTGDEFRDVLPDEVWRSLPWPWRDCDLTDTAHDWRPVDDAVAMWNRRHRELLLLDGVTWFVGTRPLYYFIGTDFVWVVDRRDGHRDYTLDALTGALYVHCMEIRTKQDLHRRFDGECGADDVDEIVRELVAADLMFEENGRVLSLAVAFRVELAVQRLRQSKKEELARLPHELHGV